MIIEPTKEFYSNLSYKKCVAERDELLKSIVAYEKTEDSAGGNCFPSPETRYKSRMRSLIAVCEAMLDKLDGEELMSDEACAKIVHGNEE